MLTVYKFLALVALILAFLLAVHNQNENKEETDQVEFKDGIFNENMNEVKISLLKADEKTITTEIQTDGLSFPSSIETFPDKKRLSLTCKKCAYVTGSGHLLGNGLGKKIDASDCVFRSNDAPVGGYEADVGSKTNIRTVDKISMDFIVRNYLNQSSQYPNLENTYVIMINHIDELNDVLGKATKQLPFLKLNSVSDAWATKAMQMYKMDVVNSSAFGKVLQATNGFNTIVLALDICEEVHVYGITYPNYCQTVWENKVPDAPYHYYRNNDLKECQHYEEKRKNHNHLFLKEKLAFEKWHAKRKDLFFHSPEWQRF